MLKNRSKIASGRLGKDLGRDGAFQDRSWEAPETPREAARDPRDALATPRGLPGHPHRRHRSAPGVSKIAPDEPFFAFLVHSCRRALSEARSRRIWRVRDSPRDNGDMRFALCFAWYYRGDLAAPCARRVARNARAQAKKTSQKPRQNRALATKIDEKRLPERPGGAERASSGAQTRQERAKSCDFFEKWARASQAERQERRRSAARAPKCPNTPGLRQVTSLEI